MPTKKPTKERYYFDGWAAYSTAYANQVVDKITVKNNSDCVVLYARWLDEWAFVTLDFGYEGIVKHASINPENPYYVFEDFFRPYYILTGWKTADGQIYKIGDRIKVPSAGLKVTAQWEKQKYTIKYYDSTTKGEYKTEVLTFDQRVLSTAVPIAGKVLSGWSIPDGTTG